MEPDDQVLQISYAVNVDPVEMERTFNTKTTQVITNELGTDSEDGGAVRIITVMGQKPRATYRVIDGMNAGLRNSIVSIKKW